MATLIHRQMRKFYGVPTREKPWLYNPQPVVTSNHVKISWNVDIRTDQIILAHRPDIVVHDSVECSAILIDVAIPADLNIVDKE